MPMTFADLVASSKDPLMPGYIKAILDDEDEGGGNVLRFLPYEDVKTLTPTFAKLNSEGPSSGVGFRPINGNYPEGTVNLYHESTNLGDIGGDIQIDRNFIEVNNYIEGAQPETLQVAAKMALINRTVNNYLVNGDRSTDPNAWNGLRKVVDPSNVLNITSVDSTLTNGAAVGPSATATTQKAYLRALDRLVDYVGAPGDQTMLLMNKESMWALDWACRESNYLNQNEDQFGRIVRTYKGVKIMNPGAKNAVETLPDAINSTNAVLPNTRTFGSSSDCAEIFAVRKGDMNNGLCILQFHPLASEVVAEHMQAGPAKLIRVRWVLGLWRPKKNAVAVLKGIRPAA